MRILNEASGTTSNVSTFASWEYQKEKREQGVENICEKIMMENCSTLVKEIDIEVQKVQRIPNMVNPKEVHTKTHHN